MKISSTESVDKSVDTGRVNGYLCADAGFVFSLIIFRAVKNKPLYNNGLYIFYGRPVDMELHSFLETVIFTGYICACAKLLNFGY